MSNELLNKYNFKLIKKLGEGSFGNIYCAINTINKMMVVLKIEKKNNNQLLKEYESMCKIIKYASENNKKINIPICYDYIENNNNKILITELLNDDLENILIRYSNLDLKSVLMITLELIKTIEIIHDAGYLHRDIKPENIMYKNYDFNKSCIYLIDFGLAKKYIHNSSHIKYKENKSLTGTLIFCSINSLLGFESSRRDDMESIGYTIIYLLLGNLPWQDMTFNFSDDKEKVLSMKLMISSKMLCKYLPEEFREYLDMCKNLNFFSRPEYDKYYDLFMKLFNKMNYVYDSIYQWSYLKFKSIIFKSE